MEKQTEDNKWSYDELMEMYLAEKEKVQIILRAIDSSSEKGNMMAQALIAIKEKCNILEQHEDEVYSAIEYLEKVNEAINGQLSEQ